MKKLLHSDLRSITIALILANLGGHMVDVFVPLLLLNKGLALWHVCLFYVAYALAKILVNYPSILLINHKGARIGLVVGYAAASTQLVLLTGFVAGYEWMIYTIPPLMALTNSFLWNSMHLHISRVMDASRKSRDLAMMDSLRRVTDIFAPLIGGLVVAIAGEAWLVGIAAGIIALAILPIRHIDRLGGGHQRAPKVTYDLRHAPRRDLIANFAFNAHAGVGLFVWPIYLAVFLPNFRSIGIITTLSSAVAFVVLFAAGKRGDEGKNHLVLMESTALSSVAHLSRIFATTPLTITLVSAFYRTVLSYQAIPWTSLYYAHTRQRGINYIMSMEIAGDLAYVAMWSVLGVTAYLTKNDTFFTVAFGAAAILAWLCLLMSHEKREHHAPAPQNP